MTWETVQKENYLAKLERQHLESSEERLKSTSSKVQSLLKIVGGFKEQEKRMSSMEAQVKYCGEVLSWLAECFSQSTLKCEREAPRVPSVKATGVTAVKAGASRDPPQNVSDKEVEPERREAKLGPSGYGANKRFPYIDQ
ncbi:transient receptor potential cation channel subfamily M member 5-like [Oncorhynchus clarkii lewisi]